MNYLDQYRRWLNSDKLSAQERDELKSIENNPTEIKERFSAQMTFGTGGLRSTMKVGLANMNRHTVAHATQGLANLINEQNRGADGVVIAHDCRNHSTEFAEVCARVLYANGIRVYMFDALRPTPELSFSLRHYHCVAGINITASHNPKQYNGYKAYWEDGAQLPPEHAETVAAAIASLDVFDDVKIGDLNEGIQTGKIRILGAETDELYLDVVSREAVNPVAVKAVADTFSVVYTPLHGTGYHLVPEILHRQGFKNVYTVAEQCIIDGNFPTVEKPNPEYPAAFVLGRELADRVGSDLIVATDPDADRVGVMTRKKDGTFCTITGNQMGALLLDYIIRAHEENGTMPPEPYVVKSIVSTSLVKKICEAHGVKLYDVLTGFKFIGEVMEKHVQSGHGSFLLGFEESYGYLKGTYARDKDAVVAAMLICEMAAYYKTKGISLYEALERLFAEYGFHLEQNDEIYMEGLDGSAKIAAMMDSLRKRPPVSFGCSKVAKIGDYLSGTFIDFVTGEKTPTGLPSSNVLYFLLENKDVIVARPSGTEPKIKFYFLLSGKTPAETEEKLVGYQTTLNGYKN